jgi:hypothetical protein
MRHECEGSTDPTSSIVTATHDFVSADIQAAHALGMSLKHAKHLSTMDIPHAQRCIARAGYRYRPTI